MSTDGKLLLQFTDVHTYYGPLHVLKGVSYEIREGEIVSLLGGNASGKSTTLKTVLGLVRPREGTVTYRGEAIHTLRTSEIVRRGIAPVPEGRRVFPKMTVLENLEMGRYTRRRESGWEDELERVYGLFPILKERRHQVAGTLSGGEQQMLAIGRALMTRPALLCMDEPSMGLSPGYVEQVFDIIKAINEQGTTIFLVEQNVNMALSIAHRGYVLQMGEVVLSGTAQELLESPLIRKAYLGAATEG
ncbi:MAG: ABC transporter ATP-binding protein [Candidatus Rokubacteria bacterium]|nr:ABC transporter ATP-binding protein [Candidatus Rokubacteria bacterium]